MDDGKGGIGGEKNIVRAWGMELIEPAGRVFEIVNFRQLLLVNPPLVF
jgi:hypothetical protein